MMVCKSFDAIVILLQFIEHKTY